MHVWIVIRVPSTKEFAMVRIALSVMLFVLASFQFVTANEGSKLDSKKTKELKAKVDAAETRVKLLEKSCPADLSFAQEGDVSDNLRSFEKQLDDLHNFAVDLKIRLGILRNGMSDISVYLGEAQGKLQREVDASDKDSLFHNQALLDVVTEMRKAWIDKIKSLDAQIKLAGELGDELVKQRTRRTKLAELWEASEIFPSDLADFRKKFPTLFSTSEVKINSFLKELRGPAKAK